MNCTYVKSPEWFRLLKFYEIKINQLVDFDFMDKKINEFIELNNLDYDLYEKLHSDRKILLSELAN